MTNLINNLNNNNILDQNLLSYGLIVGSLAIIGFSTYYFANNYLFNSNSLIKDLSSLKDSDAITQNIVNNLNAQPITGSDTAVPKLDTLSESLLYKVDESIQTMPNTIDQIVQTISETTDANVQTIANTVDANVQTPIESLEKLVKDILQEMLYNDGTPVTSLNEVNPEVFANLLRNDPNGPRYLENLSNWANNVESISRVSSSNNSEIIFLRRMTEELKDSIENIQLTNFNLFNPDYDEFFSGPIDPFMIKLYNLINHSEHLVSYQQLCNIVITSDLPFVDSKLAFYANLITNSLC
jgi:CHASE3 domain sensor protein